MFMLEYLTTSFAVHTIAVGLFQYFILKAIYNIFFHPLSTYPGPWLLAASRLPLTYAKIMGQSSYWEWRLHDKYGPVVRMAPDELSYSDSTAWRDIYASHPTRPGGMKRDTAFYESLDEKDAIPSMFNANDKDHSRIRRTYARAFSKQALARQEPIITEHVTRLMRKMGEQRERPVDLVHLFAFTMTDVMIDLQFGESLHLLDDTTHHSWVRSQFGLLRNSTILAALAELPVIKAIFQLTLPHLVRRARATHFGWMNAKLDDRLATKTNRPDIVHFVMEQAGPEATISEAELRVNLPLVMIAQTESTATVLSGLVAFLLDTPHILKQLQDEVRSTFKTSSDINMAVMEHMKVLNACINETLRMYQGAPGALPRMVPEGGAMISGQYVPGGIRVYTSPLGTFRSAANFQDPNTFHPERWYPEMAEKFADDKEAWKPFGTGTRDCIGRNMAMYLISLVICEMMLHFDIEPCIESKAWFSKQRIWTSWEKSPLLVKLTAAKVV